MLSSEKKRETYHHGDLRSQLIEATRILVEEKGPDHFSVSEACRRAGVSTAAPYKHFKDKTEMLREVALDGMRRHGEGIYLQVSKTPPGSKERLIAMGKAYIDFACREPGVFRLMFTWNGEDEDDDELHALGDGTFSFVKLEVAKCSDRTEITPEDENKAFMLWSFVHGLSFLQIDGKLTDDKMPTSLEAVLADMTDSVVPTAK